MFRAWLLGFLLRPDVLQRQIEVATVPRSFVAFTECSAAEDAPYLLIVRCVERQQRQERKVSFGLAGVDAHFLPFPPAELGVLLAVSGTHCPFVQLPVGEITFDLRKVNGRGACWHFSEQPV